MSRLPAPRAARRARPAALEALLTARCTLFRSQLKFTAKQLNRLSVKCEKEDTAEKNKVKKCMEKGNHDGARIHAQNAIRNKSNAQNYLRLSSRVDAVSSRLESALKMQQVTKSMGSVVKGMDKVLGSMNVEAIAKVMDQFEKSFENMDVTSEYVEGAMNSSTTAAMPEEQVDELMQMVADEHGLQMQDVFKSAEGSATAAPTASVGAAPVAQAAGGPLTDAASDDLEERLRKLRNN